MRFLAPSSLVAICLTATLASAGWTLINLEKFKLVELFMQRESLDIAAFTGIGAAWIVLSMCVFLVGDFGARLCMNTPGSFKSGIDFERAAKVTFSVNLVLILVTASWIAVSARSIGGLANLASLALLDSLGARDLLLENKLFAGMRLFYAALPASGCFAAGLLVVGRGKISNRARGLCWITLAINTLALFILPLVMSQRLLLLQFLLSTFLIICIIPRKIVGLRWLCIACLIFLSTWILRESITNPLLDGSPINIGLQKLAFYFVNDLWNGFAPVRTDIAHTLGAVSLRGLMFLTFTDGFFGQVLESRLSALDHVLGGGDFPFFTAAFVDFGLLGGSIFIGCCAAIFRLVFHLAHQSMFWACTYAQLGAALLFSTHGIYFTHQNFLFSIAVLVVINVMSQHRAPHQLPATTGIQHA